MSDDRDLLAEEGDAVDAVVSRRLIAGAQDMRLARVVNVDFAFDH